MQSRSDPAADATPIEQADVAVAQVAAQARHHPLVEIMGKASELADQPPLIVIASLTLAAGLIARKPRLARAGARMLASHLLATAGKSFIKDRVDRTRPKLLFDEGRYAMARGGDGDGDLGSFPSGHTAGIVSVTRALSREYPASTVPGALTAVAVAGIQVPRCTHYPTDLAGGAVVGLAAEKIVDATANAIGRAADALRVPVPHGGVVL